MSPGQAVVGGLWETAHPHIFSMNKHWQKSCLLFAPLFSFLLSTSFCLHILGMVIHVSKRVPCSSVSHGGSYHHHSHTEKLQTHLETIPSAKLLLQIGGYCLFSHISVWESIGPGNWRSGWEGYVSVNPRRISKVIFFKTNKKNPFWHTPPMTTGSFMYSGHISVISL